MSEETNVNNLNGVPNFGHGMPEDGIVVAGITDTPAEVVQEPVEPLEVAPEIHAEETTITETPETITEALAPDSQTSGE